jgi:hypothetical protein
LKEKTLSYFHKKVKLKKTQKTQKNPFLVEFFRWVFLGGFFWVGFLMPTLIENGLKNPTTDPGYIRQYHMFVLYIEAIAVYFKCRRKQLLLV